MATFQTFMRSRRLYTQNRQVASRSGPRLIKLGFWTVVPCSRLMSQNSSQKGRLRAFLLLLSAQCEVLSEHCWPISGFLSLPAVTDIRYDCHCLFSYVCLTIAQWWQCITAVMSVGIVCAAYDCLPLILQSHYDCICFAPHCSVFTQCAWMSTA